MGQLFDEENKEQIEILKKENEERKEYYRDKKAVWDHIEELRSQEELNDIDNNIRKTRILKKKGIILY